MRFNNVMYHMTSGFRAQGCAKVSIVAPVIFVLHVALSVRTEALANTYTTSFPLTENPISEGGNWINGGTVGLDWTNVRETPGFAFGTQADGGYDDSTALLTGAWGPTQTVSAVVNIAGSDSGSFEEVELRVRSSLSAHSCTGYEMTYSVKGTGAYCAIVRWNGPLNNWTELDSRTMAALHTGDIVKATAVGNTLTTYINGVPQFSVTDSTFPTGSPGIGFYSTSDGNIMNYGFSGFAATDGIASRPAAGFAGSPTNGIAPLSVVFTNMSSGATNYAWVFGDGNSSASVNPVNTYTNPGAYTVSLTASGAGGTDTLTLSNYIIVAPPPPVAGFAGSPTSGIAPLLVAFTNLSSGATNYAWTFGDGHTSASANPVNTFANPGAYSVSLTVIGAGGTNTLTLSNYIVVAAPSPVAGFVGSPTNGIAPLFVAFTNLSSGATNYVWVFGDGNSSASTNPVNTYTNPGAYSVSLTAVGAGGTDTLTLSNYILVAAAPPVAGFAGSPTSGIAPLSVSFTNLSSGATNYAWTFGDGNSSTSANPVNTYTNPGAYTVSLTAYGAGGTDTLTLSNYIVVAAPLPPPLLSVAVTNGQFSLSFGTVASQSYIIQENTNLSITNWVTVTNFLGTGSPYQFSTPATNTQSPVFFRVREP
jgi:PKD repeat protein